MAGGTVIGRRYHDIARRRSVEIGYTCTHPGRERTNRASPHPARIRAVGCQVVGLRTDNFNFASQRAIERLGAKKDGVIRHHQARRDGTIRDSVMYSVIAKNGRM
jgi:hypothetical protein